MGFSAILPIDQIDAANAALEAQGFGPGNFSVPLRAAGAPEASHAAMNAAGEMPAFRAAVEALPGVSILDAPPGVVTFAQHVQNEALEWSDPTNWTENPIMTGDQRTFDGKLWESLVDFNVWQPPVNWREIATEPGTYPAWVQPSGSTDAYPLGARVRHAGQNWESTAEANVWEPGVFGWDLLP